MPLDLNLAGEQRERRPPPAPAGDADQPYWQRTRYVPTDVARAMVKGRARELAREAGVPLPATRGVHSTCIYGTHPDAHPSFRLTDDDGGCACSCVGGHSVFDMLVHMGRAKDFEDAKCVAAELLGRRGSIVEPRQGVTLADYSAHKQLPLAFLRSIGCTDGRHWGAAAVKFCYRDVNGCELDPRYRVSLTGIPPEMVKVASPKNSRTALYGLNRRDEALERGYVIAVEGESDAQSCWLHGRPAIGLPGASNFNDVRDASWFDGIETVYIVREPDQGGSVMTKRFQRSRIADRVRVITLPVKDCSALHMLDAAGFDAVLSAAMEAAQPLEREQSESKPWERGQTEILMYGGLALETEDTAMIEGMIERDGFMSIYGPPGTSKTFFALRLGLCLSQGKRFFGRATNKTPTLYIAAEAGRSIIKRALAYADETPRQTPFAVITTAINLKEQDPQNALSLCTAIARAEQANEIKFGLIIIDTLSRVMPGADESGSVDMGNLIANCDYIRANAECAVALVHHTGKDEDRGSRGSSLLPAAVDTEIKIGVREKIFSARITKQRDGATDGVMTWRLRVVEVGRTDDDKPITTCVIEELENADVSEREARPAIKRTKAEQALDELRNIIIDRGVELPPNKDVPPQTIGIKLIEWRDRLVQTGVIDRTSPNISARFADVRDKLKSTGQIMIYDELVWPVPRTVV